MAGSVLTLIGSVIGAVVSLATGYLVYKANNASRRLDEQKSDFEHMHKELERLVERNDELLTRNIELGRKVEEFRLWAWAVVRLLREGGVEIELPPQPNGDH